MSKPAFGTWTPVLETLPREMESVLGFCRLGRSAPDVNEVYRDGEYWIPVRPGYQITSITHWMPLPPPPETPQPAEKDLAT